MTYVDDRGRLFGRFNLIDAAVGVVLLLLIPLAYGTYLLFKPAAPRIDEVTPSIISKEELRISAGGRLVAKFKIKGEGFTPLLRARIGDADALGFVFENPNSADVLVGPVGPGAHDLILLDGVQEVARARSVITIRPASAMTIRAAGMLTGLDDALAEAVGVGTGWPEGAPSYRVVALGPLMPGHRRVSLAGSTIELPAPKTRARRAVITLECDAAQGDNPCTIGDRLENRGSQVTIPLPGPNGSFNFTIEELLPSTPPIRATLRVRQAGAVVPARQGDRDDFLDERAAMVSGVAGEVVTLEAGVDRDYRGWRYRGQRLLPGARFFWSTERYETSGILLAVETPSPQP